MTTDSIDLSFFLSVLYLSVSKLAVERAFGEGLRGIVCRRIFSNDKGKLA